MRNNRKLVAVILQRNMLIELLSALRGHRCRIFFILCLHVVRPWSLACQFYAVDRHVC